MTRVKKSPIANSLICTSMPSGLKLRRTICASSRHGERFGVYMIAIARTRPAIRFASLRSGPFSGYTWKSAAPDANGGSSRLWDCPH